MTRPIPSSRGMLTDAIVEAWTSTLPGIPFDPDLTWGETGADSLETLQFALRLEKRLGRPIPLDLVDPGATASRLSILLASSGPASREPAPIHMIPGMLGDDPLLAGFRRACGETLRFEVLSPPDLATHGARLSDLELFARNIADEVEGRQSKGPIRLGGYSFGANVAFEAAALLTARGRNVAFVGLIDPVPPDIGSAPPWARSVTRRQRFRERMARLAKLLSPRGESAASYAAWLVFILLVKAGSTRAARRAALASRRPGCSDRYTRRHVHMLRRMRADALRAWRPTPLPSFAFLATSESFVRHPGHMSWPELLPKRETLELAVKHLELLQSGAVEPLAAAFRSAAERSIQPPPAASGMDSARRWT